MRPFRDTAPRYTAASNGAGGNRERYVEVRVELPPESVPPHEVSLNSPKERVRGEPIEWSRSEVTTGRANGSKRAFGHHRRGPSALRSGLATAENSDNDGVGHVDRSVLAAARGRWEFRALERANL